MTQTRKTKTAEARRCKEAMRDLVLGYRAEVEEAMRPAGITLPQLRALHAIAELQSDVSAATIARQCHVTPQTLGSILTRATREGWIVRGSSQRNGRIITARLTPTGEAMLGRAMEAVAAVDECIWRGVPLHEMESMRATIEKGLRNLQDSGASLAMPAATHPNA